MTIDDLVSATRRELRRRAMPAGFHLVDVVACDSPSGLLCLFTTGPASTLYGMWMDVDLENAHFEAPYGAMRMPPRDWARHLASWLEEELATGLLATDNHVPRRSFVELNRDDWGSPTLPTRFH